ncbi:hypothetical protein FKP32DRAFT_1755314, partial [Trametes sanguinea]
MGDPSVILIDEFSTGIDARTKREMWVTLKNVSAGKAIVITTRTSPSPLPRAWLIDACPHPRL